MTTDQKQRLLALVTKHAPDLFEAVAALRTVAEPEPIELTPRQLINAVRRTGAFAEAGGAAQIEAIIASSGHPQHEPELVLEAVSMATGIPVAWIVGSCRVRAVADARHLALSMLSRHCLRLTSVEIARLLGRTHASVNHSEKQAETLLETCVKFRIWHEKANQQLIKNPTP